MQFCSRLSSSSYNTDTSQNNIATTATLPLNQHCYTVPSQIGCCHTAVTLKRQLPAKKHSTANAVTLSALRQLQTDVSKKETLPQRVRLLPTVFEPLKRHPTAVTIAPATYPSDHKRVLRVRLHTSQAARWRGVAEHGRPPRAAGSPPPKPPPACRLAAAAPTGFPPAMNPDHPPPPQKGVRQEVDSSG